MKNCGENNGKGGRKVRAFGGVFLERLWSGDRDGGFRLVQGKDRARASRAIVKLNMTFDFQKGGEGGDMLVGVHSCPKTPHSESNSLSK